MGPYLDLCEGIEGPQGKEEERREFPGDHCDSDETRTWRWMRAEEMGWSTEGVFERGLWRWGRPRSELHPLAQMGSSRYLPPRRIPQGWLHLDSRV